MVDQPHSERHRLAAARHEAAALHDDLAGQFAETGDDELAELERRGAEIERAAAALGRDRAAVFEACGR